MKKKTLFGDVLESVTKYFFVLIGIVILLILASCIRVVESGNVAVVLRFGKLVGDTREEQIREPGLHFALPYIIDEVITIPTDSVIEQSITTYHTNGKIVGNENAGYLITGDSNVAVLSASVKYTVSDPVAYALHVNNISDIVDATVSSAMLSEAASITVDSLLTDKKAEFVEAVLERATKKLDKLGVGVALGTLELTRVAMPEEVRTVYDEVNAATVRAATIKEEAEQYRVATISTAQRQKDTTEAQARTVKNEKISAANYYLKEFWGLLEAYEANPEAVQSRVYADKVLAMMEKFSKVYIVDSEDTKVFLNPGGGS